MIISILFVTATFAGSLASREAYLGDVPYIVSIWQMSRASDFVTNNTDFQCSGALLTDHQVLTTMNCVEQSERGFGNAISVGHVNRADLSTLKFHSVVQVTPYKEYDYETKVHDLAILEISPPVTLGNEVQPVIIASEAMEIGINCEASGWRLNFFFTSNTLLIDNNVAILSGSICSNLRGVDNRIYYNGAKICAGSILDNCTVGDEGGPLVCQGFLTGLFSSQGSVCLETDPEPGFYHDIAFYSNWIKEIAPNAKISDLRGTGNIINYSLATTLIVVLITRSCF